MYIIIPTTDGTENPISCSTTVGVRNNFFNENDDKNLKTMLQCTLTKYLPNVLLIYSMHCRETDGKN